MRHTLLTRAERLARLAEAQATLAALRAENRAALRAETATRLPATARTVRRAPSAGRTVEIVSLVLLAMALAAIFGASASLVSSIRETEALTCARESIGTDSAIADCYAMRGLAIPEGV